MIINPQSWTLPLPRGTTLELDRFPRVMGVLNITPDSFSDGGHWLSPQKAIEHGLRMAQEGADLLDLGAESTRPGGGVYGGGARPVSEDEELQRLLPVVEGLRQHTDIPLSVDTRKGPVARACLNAGADLINDVGGLADPTLIAAVAEAGCPVIVMHSRGDLSNMQNNIHFEDVVGEVLEELQSAARKAQAGGISSGQLIFDSGIGFGKNQQQNLQLIHETDRLFNLGQPVLVGASRKSFIAKVHPAPPTERLGGSLAAIAWAAQKGCSLVRVHDVAETVQFLRVWNAIHLASHADSKHGRTRHED